MLDVRALAAQSISRVIRDGEAYTGHIDRSALTGKRRNRPTNQQDKPSSATIAGKERAFYRELCFGTLRYYHRLDALLKPLLKRPFKKKDTDVYALLLIGLYQIIYLRTPDHAAIAASVDAARSLNKPWATGLVNAVLRNFLRTHSDTDNANQSIKAAEKMGAAADSHPGWLYDKLKADWPENWHQIVASNNSQAAMSIRINLAKSARNEYQQLLAEQGIQSEQDPDSETGLRLVAAVDIAALPHFEQGWASVQDLGAQYVVPLLNLQPGQRVLDACAAPGGKTLHILERVAGVRLTAIDQGSERLQKVADNLQRLGQSVELIHADSNKTKLWWDGQQYDRVLIDAPCSGTGVISHHPDIKLLRRPGDLTQFADQQKQLLTNLWPLLKEHGQLVYCTCSLMPEENQCIIDWFLSETNNAMLEPIEASWGQTCGAGRQLLPIPGKNDGFFYARLSKNAAV